MGVEKVLFFRCFLGWYVLLTKKVNRRKKEYQLRVWKPLKYKRISLGYFYKRHLLRRRKRINRRLS